VTGSVHELHITAADECAASSTGHENGIYAGKTCVIKAKPNDGLMCAAIEDEVAMLRAENAQLREDVITMQSNMEVMYAVLVQGLDVNVV
jgi:hypothetical protein